MSLRVVGERAAQGPANGPFASVAVCVDRSAAANDAIGLGKALAGGDGHLTLLHAARPLEPLGWASATAPPMDWQELGTELLERLSHQVPSADTQLLKGHPSAAIHDWVEAAQPDVVVCATHHGAFRRNTLGSVASHLAYQLPVPVAIARTGIGRRETFTRVAACIDTDGRSDLVLDLSERVAAAYGGEVTAVHVMDDLQRHTYYGLSPDPDEWLAEWAKAMDDLAGDRDVEQVLLHGDFAGHKISAWAEEESIDLLVAAAHRGAVERVLVGGFANHLAHHAPCDLLVAR